MRFKLFYLLFIVCCIIYPHKVIAGPVSFRHVISLLMLGVCIYEGFRSDKYLYLYYAFVLFFGISSIATGFIGDFVRGFFGTYISMIAAYGATYLLIKKYDGTSFLVWTFVCIGLLNAFVTIGQFFDLAIVDNLRSFFRIEYDEKYVDLVNNTESGDFALPGLLNSLDNGYFLSATALLVLYNKNSNIYINLILWIVIMGASFLAQERAGFMLAIAFSAFIVGEYFFTQKKAIGYIAFIIILIICASVIYSYMDDILSSELRYSKGFEGDNRSEYRALTWQYVLNNPMGGFYAYDAQGLSHPHIFFLNAFLFGGFLGGLCLIGLLLLQIIRIIPYLFHNSGSDMAKWAFIWGLMYIDYTLNAMAHNPSIAQGVMQFFIWWGAFVASAELNEEEQSFELLENNVVEE